VTLNVTLEH